jgi:hypothetical protein
MTIAVLYAGHLRTWEQCRQNQIDNFYNEQTDSYFYTYDKPENTNFKQFIQIPGTYYDQVVHDYDSNKNPITCTDNTLQAWHNLFVGFCLVPMGYDIYVKSRCDILLSGKINFADYPVNGPDIYIPSEGDFCGGYNDRFAFGNYQTMKTYYRVYLEHLKLFQAGLTFHTEFYVTENLKRNGINIHRLPIIDTIIR